MTESLSVGDVLALTRRGGKPGTKAVGLGCYKVRWRVVAIAGGRDEVELVPDMAGPMVVLERVDDNALSQPPGLTVSRSRSSVFWMLHGGGYKREPVG